MDSGPSSERNGLLTARLGSRPPPPIGMAVPREPMSAVLELGRPRTDGLGGWLAASTIVHGALAVMGLVLALWGLLQWTRRIDDQVHARLVSVYDVELKEEAPPPPPPAEPEPKPEPAPRAAPPPKPAEAPPPPPPAAAQAGKVLTAEPDPNAPVDLTNTIITGNADSYAGGTTMANGTSGNAVRGAIASPTGVPGGTGTVPQANPAPAGPDRSRPVGLVNQDWHCPFPPEADTDQIDEARVELEITVSAEGAPVKVRVLSDPGHGFGREASRFAMRERFKPALDHDGNPIPGTKRVSVHFNR
jgi:periplasmic protein TonB